MNNFFIFYVAYKPLTDANRAAAPVLEGVIEPVITDGPTGYSRGGDVIRLRAFLNFGDQFKVCHVYSL